MNAWNGLFDAGGFAPHGRCLFWDPDLVALTLVGNIGVSVATLAIPLQLLLAALVGNVADVRLSRSMAVLIGSSVLLCGLTHLLAGITLFRPFYWLQAGVLTLAALVSLLTAALLPIDLIRSRQRGRHVGV